MSILPRASFGGGCFWGMEKWFKKQFSNSISNTAVGYMGGDKNHPSYKEVCSGQTGHAEVVTMNYDPSKVKYEELLMFFWRIHDPTTANRQGNDVGTQYRSAVFFYSPEQESSAKKMKEELQKSGRFSSPIVTEIIPAGEFWKAEDYHQAYLDKNPGGYCNHKIRW